MTTQKESVYDDCYKQYLALKQRYDAINDSSAEDADEDAEEFDSEDIESLDIDKEHFSNYLHKAIDEAPTETEFYKFGDILEKLTQLKIIDRHAELIEDMYDYMFPDRHDEGFDEDSMSYDSVFGGD